MTLVDRINLLAVAIQAKFNTLVRANGLVTITVPNGAIEWSETVAAIGLKTTDRVLLTLFKPNDSTENDPELLVVTSLAASCSVDDTLTISIAFGEPTGGPIQFFYGAQ